MSDLNASMLAEEIKDANIPENENLVGKLVDAARSGSYARAKPTATTEEIMAQLEYPPKRTFRNAACQDLS